MRTAYDCVSARCIYAPPASCEVDNECSFTQRCIVDEDDARLCAPGDCAVNDLDGQRVFARTYTGLELCDGAVNAYTYEIAENEGIEVALRHDTAQGDLALEIVEETDEGRVSLGRVDGVYGAEVLAVLPAARSRTVSIVVSGRAGSPTTYILSIQSLAQGRVDPTSCQDRWAIRARAARPPLGRAPIRSISARTRRIGTACQCRLALRYRLPSMSREGLELALIAQITSIRRRTKPSK